MTASFEPAAVAGIARLCLGEPNAALSKPDELRFGTNGSISVDLKKATYFDHEATEGGGLFDLVMRKKGLHNRERRRMA